MNPRLAAFSMVEVVMAVFIVSLIVLPLTNLLISSNKTTNYSLLEVFAVRYASELIEQFQRLSPNLKEIRLKNRIVLKNIVEDHGFVRELGPKEGGHNDSPISIQLPSTNISFFVSPLNSLFVERKVEVEPLTAAQKILNIGTYWNVCITLSWKMSPKDTVIHTACFYSIVREEK